MIVDKIKQKSNNFAMNRNQSQPLVVRPVQQNNIQSQPLVVRPVQQNNIQSQPLVVRPVQQFKTRNRSTKQSHCATNTEKHTSMTTTDRYWSF
jgi:hypothetical protein